MTDFLHDPAIPSALDLSTVDPSILAEAPDRLLGLATDLLLPGDTARGGQYLDLLERARRRFRPNRGWPPAWRRFARFTMDWSGS